MSSFTAFSWMKRMTSCTEVQPSGVKSLAWGSIRFKGAMRFKSLLELPELVGLLEGGGLHQLVLQQLLDPAGVDDALLGVDGDFLTLPQTLGGPLHPHQGRHRNSRAMVARCPAAEPRSAMMALALGTTGASQGAVYLISRTASSGKRVA